MKRKFLISNFQFLILTFVILLAGFFRFYQLNIVPPSPSLDEVSIGWNAYSILETGKDEYGYRLPVLLRAYDDWRPAGYVYLVVPFVKILGLSAISVRLPSVILSLITVLVTYFLVKELFPGISPRRDIFGLIASFFLAISPWHIYISRLGHEVNLGHFLIVTAILFFLKYLNSQKKIFLLVSSFCFALSFYTYQSLKIFTPLMVLALILLYRKQVVKDFKHFLVAGLLGLLVLIPILRMSFTSERMVRFQATSLLSHAPEIFQQSALRIARDYEQGNYLGLVFDNRRVAAGLTILRTYFSHFNPSWLFFNTGKEAHKVPNFGLFPLWFMPLLLVGAYQLVAGSYPPRTKWLLAAWLLLAPLPASLVTDAPHAMRVFNLLPVPQILVALGAIAIWQRISENWKKKAKIGLVIFLIFHLVYLYHQYFVNFPFEQSDSFQYSLKQAIEYSLASQDQYEKIVISNQKQGYQSYMFYLFFSRYDPVQYFQEGGTISGGYQATHQISKWEFRPIDWQKEEKKGKILLIGNVIDFPSDIQPKLEFKHLNGQPALLAVKGSE